jgi:hypothetical protein
MKNLTLLIALSFITLFTSCKKGDEPTPAPTERKFCIQTNDTTITQYLIQYGNIYTTDKGDTLCKNEPSLYVYPYLLQYKGVNYKPCN